MPSLSESPMDSPFLEPRIGIVRKVARSRKVVLALAAAITFGIVQVISHLIISTNLLDGIRGSSPPPPPPPPPFMDAPLMPGPPPGTKGIWSQFFGQSASRKCYELPIPEDYWLLSGEDTPAFVEIPHLADISVGESICVRVIVPPKAANLTEAFVPLPDMPWDSILLDIVGAATGISVPVKLAYVNDDRVERHDGVHIYEADVELRDADVYRPEGYLEFRDALWNPEGELLPQEYKPEELKISGLSQVMVTDKYRSSEYSLWRYLDLPLCTESDVDGRWVSTGMIPFNTSVLPLPDNLGRVWMPYKCRLQRISYEDFAKCAIEKYPRMHWYGDSNLRRVMKKISTLGEWCSTEEDQNGNACRCEDYTVPFERFSIHARDTFLDLDPVTGGNTLAGETDYARVPENKTRFAIFKMEGLTERNMPPWDARFQNGLVKKFGEPNAAIVSLVNWDAAFNSYEYFASQVKLLIGYLEDTYPVTTKLIIRTGQYHCCFSDQTRTARKYSQLRNGYFNDMHVGMIKEALGDRYSVSVWDVASLAQRRPLVGRQESTQCYSNHVRSEVVEVENQVLFNALCN